MPEKNSPNYHPLQNILSRMDYLRKKSSSLCVLGRRTSLDEGRIVSKNKRKNVHKTRNPKPIRMRWTVDKLADKGALGGYYVHNDQTKVGKYSYTYTSKSKNYNVVKKQPTYSRGSKTIVMDTTLSLVEDAREEWNTAIVLILRGNVACLPSKHFTFKKRCKKFIRGYSMALYHQGITLTHWNDNNAVCFLNNNVEFGENNWQLIEAQNKGEQIIIHIPKVAAIYRKTYGWVDRTNQELTNYNTEHRTVRKQSRVLDSMAEMYGLNNMYMICK